MRETTKAEDQLFYSFWVENRIANDHPLRAMEKYVDVILTILSDEFQKLYSSTERPRKMFRVVYNEINKENADGAAEHRFSANKQELIVVVPFDSDIGNFYVEISLSDTWKFFSHFF